MDLPCDFDEVSCVGGEVGTFARCCNKVRDHVRLAEAITVNGYLAQMVKKVRLKHERDTVPVRDQFHNGRKITCVKNIIKMNVGVLQIRIHDLTCTLVGFHQKYSFILQER